MARCFIKNRQGTVVFTILQTIVCLLACTPGVAERSATAVCDLPHAWNARSVAAGNTTDCSETYVFCPQPDRSSQNAIRQGSGGLTGTGLRNSGFDSAFPTHDDKAFCRISGRYAAGTFHASVLSGISLQVLFCTWLT
ncbi:hypothetical protein [Gimesia sp.]|uniref:hypothetical protein n=1 Tax=Gimesia sp. TaxID=2024833 RepID=UPI000C4125E0|nr:hypothetical protein [Gimesia sp.]MAX40607.1 hypothetical protein [Gimesia sp.]